MNIGKQTVINVEPDVWRIMRDLNIAKVTRRGCSGGKNKQRNIKTHITNRISSVNQNQQSGVCHANLTKTSLKTETKRWSLTKVYLCNPRSLNNKFDEFEITIKDLDLDVVGISESWFSEEKPIDHFEIDNFELITKSRTKKRGGGVAIYAREDLRVQRADIVVPDDLEVVWVKIRHQRLPRAISVLFYAIVYFPPNSKVEVNSYSLITF